MSSFWLQSLDSIGRRSTEGGLLKHSADIKSHLCQYQFFVSAQNFGVEIYSGSHDQPNGLEEDFSRIML
ncbi:hypothetical protein, partial [Nostoc sp.]|uniref:hypothetical protein n=1 Tax=Nostoc sp. TaxID=1180 RepID=UPI002FF9E404